MDEIWGGKITKGKNVPNLKGVHLFSLSFSLSCLYIISFILTINLGSLVSFFLVKSLYLD